MTLEQTQDAVVRDQILVEGYKRTLVDEYTVVILAALLASLRNRVNGLNISNFSELSRVRVAKLLKQLNEDTQGIMTAESHWLAEDLYELSETQAAFAALMTGVSPPNRKQLVAAIKGNPLGSGETFLAVLAAWSFAHSKRVSELVRRATVEGNSPAQVIQGVQGTRGNKFNDGLLAVTRGNVTTSINTAAQHTVITSLSETFSETTQYYRWVSVLDSRTSTICRSLAGRVYEYGKGPMPPQHPNCRSSIMPIPDGKSKPVSRPLYYDWLKNQPSKFQDTVLGKARGKLFRDGKISTTEFSRLQLDKNFKPVTLVQLRQLAPTAFQSAGLDD